MDAKEEVRSRLNIEEVIGEYVELKKAGRSFKGLSPFSGEKTPSFFVSPEKDIWHDFSSNKGGDIFSFVMEIEGLDFRQALELLARKAGVDLSQYQTPQAKSRTRDRARAIEAHALAARFFQQSLVKNSHAAKYVFQTRGFSKQTVQEFQIGYAPNASKALTNALLAKKFTASELSKAGLVNRFGGDLFRERMVVPLMDPGGQVIGFTGRIMRDIENAPKYLNTPETLLYNKSRHVFGLSQAKDTIRKAGFVVVVEGNLDVVSSHQAGVKNVVATAGTAMTEQHLSALHRLTSDVRLAYDSDNAGVNATERAVGMASKIGINLGVINLSGGAKDPDELIQQGEELWQKAVENPEPAVDWVLRHYVAHLDISTARGKQQFVDAAAKLIASIEARAEARFYVDKIAKLVGFSYQETLGMLNRQDIEARVAVSTDKSHQKTDFDEMRYRHEDDVLAIAMASKPSRELLHQIDTSTLHGAERQELAKYLLNHPSQTIENTPEELQNIDTYVKIVLLRVAMRYANWGSEDLYFEMARLLRQITNEQKKQKQAELVNQLRNAELAGDDALADDLRQQLNKLIKEIARGRR